MLDNISFSNFKAFKEAKIELKPLTILLGANSSGKSSILQLILLLKQTLNLPGEYDSALKINGPYVLLGEAENIIRNRDIKKNDITISFKILGEELQRHIKQSLYNIINDIIRKNQDLQQLHVLLSNSIGPEKNRTREMYTLFMFNEYNKVERSSIDVEELIKSLRLYKRKILKILEEHPDVLTNLKEKQKAIYLVSLKDNLTSEEFKNFDPTAYEKSYKLLKALNDHISNEYHISFTIRAFQDRGYTTLKTEKISIYNESLTLLDFEYNRPKGKKPIPILRSDVFDNFILDQARNNFWKKIYFDTIFITPRSYEKKSMPSRIKKSIKSEVFLDTIYQFFDRATFFLKKEFETSKINYVSPLRAFPKRYYFLDKANISSSLDTIDGDNLTEILKKDKNVRRKVNDWLKTFNLSVDIEDLRDNIHKIKINQNGLDLDITDVGFGISQILPIIVQGFLSRSKSITLIEQPEIHLHPKMQAELGDLFIDILFPVDENGEHYWNGKKLIIETHSEYLLKRIRRRMAENKNISPDDVAIYFVHPRENKNSSARLEKIEISSTGAFDWPQEFYATDMDDTIEFMKHQN